MLRFKEDCNSTGRMCWARDVQYNSLQQYCVPFEHTLKDGSSLFDGDNNCDDARFLGLRWKVPLLWGPGVLVLALYIIAGSSAGAHALS
eukprot:COSAG02_NODE_62298_length_266_cov_0.622754_1_plen_88_part_11